MRLAALVAATSLPKVKKDPKLPNEATQKPDGIHLGPKFFKLDSKTKRSVLTHELGHWYRDKFLSLSDIMGWEPGEGFYDLFGAGNSEEGFAEAFAVFLINPNEVKKRYPEAYGKLKDWLRGKESLFKKWVQDSLKGLEAEGEVVPFNPAPKQEEPYPPGGALPKDTGRSIPDLNNELQHTVRDEPKPK
jgi:hypothetical protein